MEMNEAIDTILDYLRDHGQIVRELESGPWLSVYWTCDTDDGVLRGKVTRLKDNDFRYARTVSLDTLSVLSVFGQDETFSGGSAADIIEVANRVASLNREHSQPNEALPIDQSQTASTPF